MSSKSPLSANLLDELDAALAHGTVARRVETLRRVTDLFVNNAVDYSDAQIAVFDDIFDCLLTHMEASARALLAERLAPVSVAPPRVVRTLAFDDLIEVAAPVLSQSEQLDDHALIENARTKSQDHLLELFQDVVGRALAGEPLPRAPQGEGRYLSRAEFDELRVVRPGDDLPRKLRAFWYPPWPGAVVELDGRRLTLVDDGLLADVARAYRDAGLLP